MGLGLGPFEMVLIFGVLLLLFGAKKLPELATGMGKGIRGFKHALHGVDEPSLPPPVAVQPLQSLATPAEPVAAQPVVVVADESRPV